MDDGEDPGNVFAIPDLDRESHFYRNIDIISSLLFSSINFDGMLVRMVQGASANLVIDINKKRVEYGPPTVPNEDFFSIADISLDLPDDVVTPSTSPEPELELPPFDDPDEGLLGTWGRRGCAST